MDLHLCTEGRLLDWERQRNKALPGALIRIFQYLKKKVLEKIYFRT